MTSNRSVSVATYEKAPMKKLQVRLTWRSRVERVIGQLALPSRGRVVFEYDPAFLRDPLWLSPFKLPPQPGVVEHRDVDFGPIFGLFDDSLPDAWGLLLMDRFLRQRGSVLAEVSVLDRLAFLGTRTMGALTYHPPSDPADRDAQLLDLHEMATASEQVLDGSAPDVLPQLLRAGGSPGGARPKVLIGLRGDSILSGESELPSGYAAWMVKFGSQQDPADIGPIELAYSRLARQAGIQMPATRLFETAQGGRYFGVERFDRRGNQRVHVHTFGNLIHANFRLPSCDYRQLLEVTRVLTRNHQDVLEVYRRMTFNVLAHNRDDHVKNFAFLMTESGEWRLAPAYDLVFSHGPGGEHSTTVADEGRAPGREHLLRLAGPAGVTRDEAEAIFEAVASAVAVWDDVSREAGVSARSRKELGEVLHRSRL